MKAVGLVCFGCGVILLRHPTMRKRRVILLGVSKEAEVGNAASAPKAPLAGREYKALKTYLLRA